MKAWLDSRSLGVWMRYLVDARVRTAQELSWRLSSLDGPQQFKRAVQELLVEIFAADYCGLNDVSLRRPDDPFRLDIYPQHPAVTSMTIALAEQVLHEPLTDHPVINHYADSDTSSRPIRLSDLVSDRQLRRTAAYSKALKPIGASYELVMLTRRAKGYEATGFALTRSSTDFPDETLAVADAVQPVLVAMSACLRVRDGVPAPGGWDGMTGVLTRREMDILQLVAAGLTAQAIARACRISTRTVHKHLEHAYAKLGVHDRLSAVNYCRRVGLLS